MIQKADGAAKYNMQVLVDVGNYYLTKGLIDKGLSYIDRATSLRPFFNTQWFQRIDAYDKISMYYLQNKDTGNFKKYCERGLAVVNESKEVNRRNLVPFVFADNTVDIIEWDKYVLDAVNSNKGADRSKLKFYNLPWLDVNSDNIPDQWQAVGEGSVRLEAGKDSMTADGKAGFIKSRELKLTEGKTYRIDVELADGAGISVIPFTISDKDASGGELAQIGNTFSMFVMAPKLQAGDKYALKLKVDGKYEIKGVTVMEAEK
jgi:hypothetical protein